MNKAEISLLNYFLDDYRKVLSNHSCNDLWLDNTVENRELIYEAHKDSDYPEAVVDLPINGPKIGVCDFIMFAHLRKKLMKCLTN